MSALYTWNTSALIFSMSVFYLLSVGQAYRIVVLLYRRGVTHHAFAIVYECFILVHLLLAALLLNAAAHAWSPLAISFPGTYIALEPLFYANACAAVLGLVLCISARKFIMVFELVFLVSFTPWLLCNQESLFSAFLIADMAFFTFRVVAGIVLDLMRQKKSVSRNAAIDAIKLLPEGILCANKQGDVLFMNDAMRSLLAALKLPGDFADVRKLCVQLQACALPNRSLDEYDYDHENAHKHTCASEYILSLEEGIFIEVPDCGTWLFASDFVMIDFERALRIVALDITEEYHLKYAIEKANEKLVSLGYELSSYMEHVQEAAENEALLRMYSRVHDIVGQRLSLLHRLLEEGNVSDDQLKSIKPALVGILDDLQEIKEIDKSAELNSIVEAFRLVDANITIEGKLPESEKLSEIVVNVVREAATNAVRHACAKHIFVKLTNEDTTCVLTITNDGIPCKVVKRANAGMRGMRHAAQQVRGSFSYLCGPPFTIIVKLPLENIKG